MKRILVVLAAGRGERLRPLTDTRPKPLMPILGEPIVCRHLRLAGSFDKVLVVVSYMGDEVSRVLESCMRGVAIVTQDGEKGTGDALRRAMEEGGPGLYTVIYGDVFMHPSYYKVLGDARDPVVLAAQVGNPWEYGVLKTRDGVLEGIVEKPRRGEEPGNLVFIGGLKARYEDLMPFLESLTLSPRGEYELTDAITRMASRMDVVVASGSGYWVDIGRPWDLLKANRLALEHELNEGVHGEVSSMSVVEGRVYVAPTARIDKFSLVEGPTYIGEDVHVGPNSHIRPYTVLLKGVHVGFSSQVKASIMMEESKAPHLNYVGDSIVGEHVNLGAGTVTANLRFDGATVKMRIKGRIMDTGMRKLGAVIGGYAKTGINVSILPGVKIGSHALIYPGCIVYRDVEPGEKFKCRQEPM